MPKFLYNHHLQSMCAFRQVVQYQDVHDTHFLYISMNLVWVSVHARGRNDDIVPACRHRWISVDWHNTPETYRRIMVGRRVTFIVCNIFAVIVVVCPIGDMKDRFMMLVFELLRRFDCFWISSLLMLLLLRRLIWFWLAGGGECCWLLVVSR